MKKRILAQLQVLDDALGAWRRYRKIAFQDLAANRDVQYMVCHAMLLAIQAAIDSAMGIAVMKTPKRPGTYRETFALLGDHDIIPRDLARELSRLAGFRNLLVHEYTALDFDRVFRTLQDDMQVLESFRDHVKVFLRENDL